MPFFTPFFGTVYNRHTMQVERPTIFEIGDFHIAIDDSADIGIQSISLCLDKDIAIDVIRQIVSVLRNPERMELIEFIIGIRKVNCPAGECPYIRRLDGTVFCFIDAVVGYCQEPVICINCCSNLYIIIRNRSQLLGLDISLKIDRTAIGNQRSRPIGLDAPVFRYCQVCV